MSFTVKTRKVEGDVAVIDAAGKLTIGAPVLALRQALRGTIDHGGRKFVLDLGNVSYIDSSGLGELVASFTALRSHGGDVKLLHLTPKTRDLLQITKLLTVFDTFEDESMAIASLSGESDRITDPTRSSH